MNEEFWITIIVTSPFVLLMITLFYDTFVKDAVDSVRKKERAKKYLGKKVKITGSPRYSYDDDFIGKDGIVCSTSAFWEEVSVIFDNGKRESFSYKNIVIINEEPKSKKRSSMPRIFKYSLYLALVVLVWKFVNNIDQIVVFIVSNYL